MNSRTIIRELSQETSIGLIDDEETSALCAETKAILEADPICKKHFTAFLRSILPFLTDIPQKSVKEKEKKQDNEIRINQFRFILTDFSVALERSYLNHLCDDLKLSVKPNNENEMRVIVSSLLSDLADRGWPLETLFTWPHNYLKSPATHTFDENLDFMLRILQNPRQDFEVTLKLSKCASLSSIGQHEDFSFSSVSGITTADSDISKFAVSYQSVCFAKTRVQDFDHRSAAINARDTLEQIVDVLRFGFEPDKLSIEDICHVKRLGDNKEEIIAIPHVLPNPTDDIPYKDFISFSGELNTILKKTTIEQKSRRQLQAAIRQYRFGRDIDNYSDKFLYWWMGLEALARDETGPIGTTVAHNVSYCMAILYLKQIFDDYLHTLQFCKIGWPEELAKYSGAKDLDALSSEQLLTVIYSKHKGALLKLCDGHPTLSFYGKTLAEALADPKRTAQLLRLHLNHLKWHLARLWRIRCSIVHGSESRFRLRLFAANLEYYLRQMILISMSTFKNHDHIASLQELFLRASIGYEHSIESLEKQDATQDAVRSALVSDILLMVDR